MELEATTSLFYGFYESIHLNYEEISYYEIEDLAELETRLNQELENNFYIVYEWSDQERAEYFNTVGVTFMDNMKYLINYYIPDEIKQKDYYELEIEYQGVYSTKYYNYTTDKIDYKIKTNEKTMQELKKYILNHQGAEQYIFKRFKSYDGFISFLSNDIDYWKTEPIETDEKYIGALIDMLLKFNDKDITINLNMETLEDIDPAICYMTPYLCSNKTGNQLPTYKEDQLEKFIKQNQ